MRGSVATACILLSGYVAPCLARDVPGSSDKVERVTPSPQALLAEASGIVLKQDSNQHNWTDRLLLDLADLQIRAGDFEGALRSIRASTYQYRRDTGLLQLAGEVARRGNKERALDILRLLGSEADGQRPYFEDRVRLRWIEHLVASGDIEGARKTVELLKTQRYRGEGLRKLGVAYSKAGDAARASDQFTLALDAAKDVKDDFDRARAYWETADALLSAGKTDAAKETMRRLVEIGELKNPWVKVIALREAAVVAARATDQQASRRLFRRAIEAREAVDEQNKLNALKQIAVAQARVAYIEDALNTAAMIPHSDKDFTQDGEREEALCAIAVVQLKADDVDGAVRTALSVEHFLQYRDDALRKVVDYQIAKRDLKTALTMAGKIHNPSRKAAAILRVATAHAKSGDYKTAGDLAGRIELTRRDRDLFPGRVGNEHFDYLVLRSWGVCYDAGTAFTMASHQRAIECAADVAQASMTLWQALGPRTAPPYAVLFNEIHTEEVVRALARAHAASGDPSEALAWAKRVGSSDKLDINARDDACWAVQRRVHALMGVAEGILDR